MSIGDETIRGDSNEAQSPPRDVVLVHGSANTGRCWDLLRPALEARGFVTHAPTLAGRSGSAKRCFAPGLNTWVEDVLTVMRRIDRPVLLVGHSLGGLVISGVADRAPSMVRKAVYLAALAPAIGRMSQLRMPPLSEAVTKTMRLHLNGTASWAPEAAIPAFYNQCAPEVQQLAVERMCAQPLLGAASSMMVTAAGFGSVEKHYIETTNDKVLPLESQRKMQTNTLFDSIRTVDSDHSPFYSMPELLADRIAEIAGE